CHGDEIRPSPYSVGAARFRVDDAENGERQEVRTWHPRRPSDGIFRIAAAELRKQPRLTDAR
ncbi:unnamed protein product, partial [Phaeothamnion confervicola]